MVASESMRTLYRITRTSPPTEEDFWSHAQRGIRPYSDDPEVLRCWTGVSFHDSFRSAVRKARRVPNLGQFIAEIRLPVGGVFRIEKTMNDPSHFTIWGDAADLLATVVRVARVPDVVR